MSKSRQINSKPTKKLQAATLASILFTAALQALEARGWVVSPEDASVLESALAIAMGGLFTFVAGWFKRPSEDDGITTRPW